MKLLREFFIFFLLLFSSVTANAVEKTFDNENFVQILNADLSPVRPNFEELRFAEAQLDQLLESKSDPLKLRNLAHRMVRTYLMGRHIQEALWVLYRAGLTEDADTLENYIRQTLLESRPQSYVELRDHLSRAKWWVYSNGVEALGKAGGEDPGNFVKMNIGFGRPEYEAFAYELDRLLGINRIPLTVVLYRQGEPPYSLQLRLKSSRITGVHYKMSRYQSDLPYASEVYVIDYLTGQTDRHHLNSLYTATGRLALIDNERSFGDLRGIIEPTPTPANFLKNGGKIPPQLIARINSVTAEDLKVRFSNLLSDSEINFLTERFEILKESLQNSCRSLIP